jgi:hypothetical protein
MLCFRLKKLIRKNARIEAAVIPIIAAGRNREIRMAVTVANVSN